MKKILFVANIHKHFKAFHIPYINWLKSQGYEVHVAANDGSTIIDEADKQFNIPIDRNPFSINNIRAIMLLKQIIKNENYCLIHCHTAMGSVTARLAAKTFITDGLKIIYTVHGFHFYKGSPNKYWSIFFPVEKYLSKYTNAIVTINKEDFELISNSKFKNSFSFLIPGVGINTSKFDNIIFSDKDIIRKKNGYQSDTFLILYIAEFIPRKNHEFLLEVVSDLQEKISNFKVLLAGRGVFLEKTKASAKNIGVQDYIDFLGFREDIGEVITMSDIGVSVSKQEGLPMNIAEVMYAGKPVVASKIRGHADLINHKENGFLYDVGDKESFINYIEYLYKNPEARLQIGKEAKLKSKQFELEQCLQEMKKIYSQFLDV